jgi:L-aminopeptidase/D-esterase-like protein
MPRTPHARSLRAATPVAALVAAALAGGVTTVRTQPAAAPGPDRRGLTAVDGLKVGSVTLTERPTGCTVILVDGAGAVGGVSQRGGAPGTRETDLLDPGNMVDKVNAVVLSGGSAFGLDAATGTVRWLEEHNMGWDVRVAKVPIVPSAILFDLPVGGNAKVRPTADCGYKAAAAATNGPVQEGSIGAGAGATVGKSGGPNRSMKAGLGSYAIRLPNGLVVGAIVAVNAVGDIIDPDTGKVVAGVRNPDGSFADAFARAIFPSHTMGDGDTVFSLATGTWTGETNITQIGALAADVLATAIVRAATEATGLPNLPAVRDLPRR